MKKIGFIVQVLTLSIALPLLTALELNHADARPVVKKTSSFVIAPAEKNAAALGVSASCKMPS